MKLKDDVAIVTGGSKGIGASISKELAKEGCNVVINYFKHKEEAKKIKQYIENEFGRKVLISKADIGNLNEIKKLVSDAINYFGKINILVNNAGISIRIPFFEVTEQILDRTMNINLKGVFMISQLVSKEMIKIGGGTIINISSIAGQRSMKDLSHYCASKGGIDALTKSMAIELAHYRIRVNAIAPGPIDVERNRKSDPNFPNNLIPFIPLERIGKSEDISKIVVFLCSDESSYLTGQVINICGGLIDYVPPWK